MLPLVGTLVECCGIYKIYLNLQHILSVWDNHRKKHMAKLMQGLFMQEALHSRQVRTAKYRSQPKVRFVDMQTTSMTWWQMCFHIDISAMTQWRSWNYIENVCSCAKYIWTISHDMMHIISIINADHQVCWKVHTGKFTYMYYSWKVIKHEKASQWQMHWHNGDWLLCYCH